MLTIQLQGRRKVLPSSSQMEPESTNVIHESFKDKRWSFDRSFISELDQPIVNGNTSSSNGNRNRG